MHFFTKIWDTKKKTRNEETGNEFDQVLFP